MTAETVVKPVKRKKAKAEKDEKGPDSKHIRMDENPQPGRRVLHMGEAGKIRRGVIRSVGENFLFVLFEGQKHDEAVKSFNTYYD